MCYERASNYKLYKIKKILVYILKSVWYYFGNQGLFQGVIFLNPHFFYERIELQKPLFKIVVPNYLSQKTHVTFFILLLELFVEYLSVSSPSSVIAYGQHFSLFPISFPISIHAIILQQIIAIIFGYAIITICHLTLCHRTRRGII